MTPSSHRHSAEGLRALSSISVLLVRVQSIPSSSMVTFMEHAVPCTADAARPSRQATRDDGYRLELAGNAIIPLMMC